MSVQSRDNDNEAIFLLVHTRQVVKTCAEKKYLLNGSQNLLSAKVNWVKAFLILPSLIIDNSLYVKGCIFKQPAEKLNIEIATNEKEYSLRKKVNIELISRVSGASRAS